MESPLVSVIIPCFNYGKYIDFTVDSVLSQTYRNVEIFIVDDGSTDPFTIKKLKEYNRPATSVVHQKNNYPSAARNKGFQYAKGQYILIIDADDMVEKSFLEKAIAIFERDTKNLVGAVSSEVLKFGQYDTVWYPLGGSLERFILNINCHSCALVRREAWNQAEGFDEALKEGYEDWDFWIRVTKQGWDIQIIPESLIYYRTKEGSRVNEAFKNHWSIYHKIIKNHPDVFKHYLNGESLKFPG